jgi:hypothetical protein
MVGIRGFPTEAVKKTDIIGVDFDPYDTEAEHRENFVIPNWFLVAAWRGRVVYDGFCSTYREWHIWVQGFNAGLRTGTWEDLPKCPVLWQDEAQYYETAASLAYDLKRGSQGAIGTIVAAILALKGFNTI